MHGLAEESVTKVLNHQLTGRVDIIFLKKTTDTFGDRQANDKNRDKIGQVSVAGVNDLVNQRLNQVDIGDIGTSHNQRENQGQHNAPLIRP